MRLEFTGVEAVHESAERVWQLLMDHRVVASCAPGVESVEAIDETHFNVTAALGVGNVKLRFALNVTLSELVPPKSGRMTMRGQAPGSRLNAETSFQLESPGPASTRLTWTVASDVHGTVASVGARLLRGTAKKLTGAFWKKFAKRVAAPARGKPPMTVGKKR